MNRSFDEKRVSYPLRAAAALIVVAGLSIGSSWNFYRSRRLMNAAAKDSFGVAYFQQTLGPALHEVPSGATVAYVSDTALADPRGIAQFFAVQYAIAPRLLVEEARARRPEWIVGLFAGVPDLSRYAGERGWIVERDLGDGVVLFRRQDR